LHDSHPAENTTSQTRKFSQIYQLSKIPQTRFLSQNRRQKYCFQNVWPKTCAPPNAQHQITACRGCSMQLQGGMWGAGCHIDQVKTLIHKQEATQKRHV